MLRLNKIIIGVLVLICLSLTACGNSGGATSGDYADGVYTARSEDFRGEDGSETGSGYGVVELEIKNNKVVSCTFTTYELNGTVKDESYGADLSKENRLKAQKAAQSAGKYASKLAETGSLDGVDAISGATITYNEFVDAVNKALKSASVK